MMKESKLNRLLVATLMLAATTASAQRGASIDIGKNHPEDTTHVTGFSLGPTMLTA